MLTVELCAITMAPRVPVTLHVYDLSQGMARQFSPMILGKEIGGIWHTGIVVFGTEYYFGGGICTDPPRMTPYGAPVDTVSLGTTTKSVDEFKDYLLSISSQFSMSTYDLLENNCNNFSDSCAKFLMSSETGIPSYIVDLPREAMDSPMGPMLRPMIENMQSGIRDQSAGHELNFGRGAPPSTQSTPSHDRGAPTAIARCAEKPILLTRTSVGPVLAKLRDLDSEYPKVDHDVNESAPPIVELLAAEKRAAAGKAFPALDLLRMAVLRDVQSASLVCSALPSLLERHVLDNSAPRPDLMMALRVAVNAFAFKDSAVSVMSDGVVETLVEAAAVGLGHGHAAVAKTAAALAMNIAGARRRHPEALTPLGEELVVRLIFAAVERAKSESAPSTDDAYPLIGAIAVIVNADADSRELVRSFDLDLAPYIDPERCPDSNARAVAMELDVILRN